jgi:hypothetical protein
MSLPHFELQVAGSTWLVRIGRNFDAWEVKWLQ